MKKKSHKGEFIAIIILLLLLIGPILIYRDYGRNHTQLMYDDAWKPMSECVIDYYNEAKKGE